MHAGTWRQQGAMAVISDYILTQTCITNSTLFRLLTA
jgi:hypothetical protein